MYRPERRRRNWLLTFTLAAAVIGCRDAADPTASMSGSEAAFAPGGQKPAGTQVKIRRLMLDGGTFLLEGPAVGYAFEVDNNLSDQSGVSVEVTIVQGNATRVAGSFPATCPLPDGGLPQGECAMTGQATASNAAPGTGVLVPGDAQFVLTLYQDAGGTRTVLATKKLGIGLSGQDPFIADVQLSTTELTIGGVSVPYVAILSNPTGAALTEVFAQGELIQGSSVGGAGGFNVVCPPDNLDAVLPAGTCTTFWTADASGSVGFVPGDATFVLTLNHGFSDPVVLDTWTVPVTLVAAEPPAITNLTMPVTTLIINGPRVDYSFTAYNPGEPLTDILFQGVIRQGAVENPAGGVIAHCPTADGVLPTGPCDMAFTAGAETDFGPLAPGAAEFILIMYQTSGPTTELTRVSIPITLTTGS